MLQLSFSALSFAPSHFTCPPSLPWLLPCYASTVLPLYPVMLQLSSLFVLSFALLCFNCPPSLSYHASTVLPLCPIMLQLSSLSAVFCLIMLQLSPLFALSFALSRFNCPPSLPCLPVTKIATYHHDLVQAKRKKECCMGPPKRAS